MPPIVKPKPSPQLKAAVGSKAKLSNPAQEQRKVPTLTQLLSNPSSLHELNRYLILRRKTPATPPDTNKEALLASVNGEIDKLGPKLLNEDEEGELRVFLPIDCIDLTKATATLNRDTLFQPGIILIADQACEWSEPFSSSDPQRVLLLIRLEGNSRGRSIQPLCGPDAPLAILYGSAASFKVIAFVPGSTSGPDPVLPVLIVEPQ